VNLAVRLSAALQIDAGAVNDGFAARECPGQRCLVINVRADPGCVLTSREHRQIGMTGNQHHIVAVGQQRLSCMTADEATCASDCDAGHSIATLVAGPRRAEVDLPSS